MASASAGEVRGPVAMMTLDQSAGGRPATSARSMLTRGWASRRAVISAEKGTRSMASALPAGTAWRSALAMTRPPAARISQCSRPTAFCSSSSERKELEQTSSARRVGLVGEGADVRAHLVQDDGDAHRGGLPGGLGAGEAAADDVDRVGLAHGGGSRPGGAEWKGLRFALAAPRRGG